ncbi:MAG: hypothetical protein M1814_001762 [Vezdaea aestivalis]|nr:MAG: hypothetical protein M1814_001762 [Vezdaea aestivalis]
MSLGLSASDFITVPRFAWKVYIALKTSSSNYRDLCNEVLTVHVVLKEIEENIENIDSDKSKRLAQLALHCKNVLEDIEEILIKYDSLGTQAQRAWDRMKFGMEDLPLIRSKLEQSINSLTAFNCALTQASITRLEKLLTRYVAEKQAGSREGTTISVQTLQSIRDDPGAWRDFERDLKDVGVTNEMLHEHRAYITKYIQKAIANGLLDENSQDNKSTSLSLPSTLDFASVRERCEEVVPQGSTELKYFSRGTQDVRQPLPENSTHSIVLPLHSDSSSVSLYSRRRPQPFRSCSQSGSASYIDSFARSQTSLASSFGQSSQDTEFDSLYSPSLSHTASSAESSINRSPTFATYPFGKSFKVLGIQDASPKSMSKEPHEASRSRKGSVEFQSTRSLSFKDHFRAPKLFSAFSSTTSVHKSERKPSVNSQKSRRPSSSQDAEGNTPLHNAVLQQDLATVLSLLNDGARSDSQNKNGNTPLHLAAEMDAGQILSTLMLKGADVEVENSHGSRVMHVLARSCSDSTMRTVLAAPTLFYALSPMPNHRAQDEDGKTPLYCAAEVGNDTAFYAMYHALRANCGLGFRDEWLASSQIPNNKGESPIHAAAHSGNVLILRKLCGYGTKKARQSILRSDDGYFNKPLHFAAMGGHREAVAYLLRIGAKCGVHVENATNGSGLTPLFVAIEQGHTQAVEELLLYDSVDVNQDCPMGSGQTPLVTAQKLGNVRIKQMLMARGAAVSISQGGGGL